MSYPHQDEQQPMARAEQPRSGFSGPRLELPRFQFAPSSTLARTPERAPERRPDPAPAPVAHQEPTPAWLRPSPAAPQYAAPAPAAPQYAPAPAAPQYAPAPAAPQYAAMTAVHPQPQLQYATAAPAPVIAQAPRQAPRPAPQPMANTTSRASTVAWSPTPPPAERTLLQRISPVHMGVLMVMVMIVMVVSSGPAAMNAKPSRLPATVSGGGTGDVPMPIRAGATAVDAVKAPATGAKAKTSKAKAMKAPRAAARAGARSRMLVVGSARLRPNVRAGGIPSPAAAANLAVAGGGRVAAADTGSVRMGGIPSPAASEQLGPQKLPFRPTDGVTLPRAVGERDSHAVERHYGNDTLPMEEPALPAMTPGAAAAAAEHQVQVNNLTGGSAPQPVAGGLAMAY